MIYTDNNEYCCKVLRARIADGGLPDGTVDERPIESLGAADLCGHNQIHLFAGIGGFPLGFKWAGVPDDFSILTGGFPCQDVSFAGGGQGLDGAQSGLWWEMLRVIRMVRPRWVVVENVAALLNRGMGTVVGSLAESGYRVEWDCIPASAIGAPHRRDRVWIVAHANSEGQPDMPVDDKRALSRPMGPHGGGTDVGKRAVDVADANLEGLEIGQGQRSDSCEERQAVERAGRGIPKRVDGLEDAPDAERLPRAQQRKDGRVGGEWEPIPWDEGGQWAVEPDVGRVANGVPKRVDRLKGLGNAIVPQIAEYIGRQIMAADTNGNGGSA